MIDLHTHVLPRLDDGPVTIEGSLALARAAVAAGTETMVATPHINDDCAVDPREVAFAVEALNHTLERHEIELEVVPGGEVSIARLGRLARAELDEVRLGDGPYVLVESPHVPLAGALEATIFELQVRGYQVLLAHPERSPVFLREPVRLRRLVEAGALCSITAGSIAGRFGRTVRAFTLTLLREGLVHDVASDAHDDRRRPPGLLAGFADAEAALPGLAGQADWLTRAAPEAILAGEPLPARPELDPPRSRAWRVLRRGR